MGCFKDLFGKRENWKTGKLESGKTGKWNSGIMSCGIKE
jgi:hypothetical protein